MTSSGEKTVELETPYGYLKTGEAGGLEPDPAEQRVLSVMESLRESGMSWRQVVAELTMRGEQGRIGRTWHHIDACRCFMQHKATEEKATPSE